MSRIAAAAEAAWNHVDRVEPGDAGRAEVEQFIVATYRRRFGAEVRQFMPHLLAFRDRSGALVAALGLRCGSEGPLFVEHYLERPLEQTVAALLGERIERSDLVELGSFAAVDAGAGRRLVEQMIPLLSGAGKRWVVFVATRQLRNSFARMGLAPRFLGRAQAACLGALASGWGRYYEHAPELLLGDLSTVERTTRAYAAEPGCLPGPACAVAR